MTAPAGCPWCSAGEPHDHDHADLAWCVHRPPDSAVGRCCIELAARAGIVLGDGPRRTLDVVESEVKSCAGCGTQFSRPPGRSTEQWARQRHCSRSCIGLHPAPPPAETATVWRPPGWSPLPR